MSSQDITIEYNVEKVRHIFIMKLIDKIYEWIVILNDNSKLMIIKQNKGLNASIEQYF
jgi:hypothetical protein